MWVKVLSDILNSLCKQNLGFQASKSTASKFSASCVPKISIDEYVSIIVLCSHCSEECFVLALIYLERLVGGNQGLFVNSYNVHRLFLTSVMIAGKYFDDESFDNTYYSRLGGLSLKEINELEREFLLMINFNVHAENELFTAWNDSLISHHDMLVTTSQQNELTNFYWEDEVVSLLASIVSISGMLTPSKGFPQIAYGNAAKFGEIFISPRLKPGCSNCECPRGQYPNECYIPHPPRMYQTNICVQTY